MTRWQWAVLLVLLIVAFALVVDRDDDAIEPELAPPGGGSEPDLHMEDATITQFNEDGSLRYRLVTSRISHFERQDLTRLQTPALEIRHPPQPPWSIEARSGTIRYRTGESGEREEIVELADEVRLAQTRERGFVEVTTDALEVHPARRFAATDRAVMIDTNAGRTRAVGLTADLDSALLRLSSDGKARVHTIVLPSQFRRVDETPGS